MDVAVSKNGNYLTELKQNNICWNIPEVRWSTPYLNVYLSVSSDSIVSQTHTPFSETIFSRVDMSQCVIDLDSLFKKKKK